MICVLKPTSAGVTGCITSRNPVTLTQGVKCQATKGAKMSVLLSASQAAKQVGKSVPTITRAIKSGKLSAKKKEGGGYEIDPSELFRVWSAIKTDATPVEGNDTDKESGHETHKNGVVTEVLEAEVKFLKQLLEDRDTTIADIKEQRDKWQEQAQTLSLTNQAQPQGALTDTPERRSWLERVLSRR